MIETVENHCLFRNIYHYLGGDCLTELGGDGGEERNKSKKETAAIPTSLPSFIRKRKKRERKESVRRTKDLAFLLLLTGLSYAINMSRV
jgi:hypothetical protein